MAKAPPPARKRSAPPAAPKTPPKVSAPPTAAKSFSIAVWDGSAEGEKIVLYGESGAGKTTLATMAPRPLFIGPDDGARKIKNPLTGEHVHAVQGIENFDDLLAFLRQPGCMDGFDTLVLDTVTRVQDWIDEWVLANIKAGKDQTAKNLEAYGFGKGYVHSESTLRTLLSALDVLVRQGKNVILIAQSSAAKIANAEGLDYLKNGPKLHHTSQASSRGLVCEWADHVVQVGYAETAVAGVRTGDKNAVPTKGKVVSTDTTRVLFVADRRHATAKSRTLTDSVISYETPDDNSLWEFMFQEDE